jgi:TPR repeat protein
MYQQGQGVRQDLTAALKWFKLAAESNEPHAACRLGDLYFSGQGVEKDEATARKWYEREAQHGCGHAQFALGQCAELESKQDEAMLWYRRAATNGALNAEVFLGERLSDGLGPKQDYVEAYLWYRVAAEGGDRVAKVSARRLKTKLSPDQLQQVEKEIRKLRKRIEEKPTE